MRYVSLKSCGFTIVEVLLASTIGGFVALVAVGAFHSVSTSSQQVHQYTEIAAEVRFAADLIAKDLANVYRDGNYENMKFVGLNAESGPWGSNILTFYTVNRAKARADQPEADVYEVEYFLLEEDRNSRLYRRLWPNPDKDREAGGVMTLIAENIYGFTFRFFDGQEWVYDWSEEMRSLPGLVEVTLVGQSQELKKPTVEIVIANFARLSQSRSSEESGNQQEPSSENEESGGGPGGESGGGPGGGNR